MCVSNLFEWTRFHVHDQSFPYGRTRHRIQMLLFYLEVRTLSIGLL
jgi:hypothetical protein